VGPLENQPLMICFIGGFLFWARFGPSFVFFEGKEGLKEVKGRDGNQNIFLFSIIK
jgi:hypothetical protein